MFWWVSEQLQPAGSGRVREQQKYRQRSWEGSQVPSKSTDFQYLNNRFPSVIQQEGLQWSLFHSWTKRPLLSQEWRETLHLPSVSGINKKARIWLMLKVEQEEDGQVCDIYNNASCCDLIWRSITGELLTWHSHVNGTTDIEVTARSRWWFIVFILIPYLQTQKRVLVLSYGRFGNASVWETPD